jgi:beta-lactam-binding protein with PASTA domain
MKRGPFAWVVVAMVAGCKVSSPGSLFGGGSMLSTRGSSGGGDDAITVPDLFLRTRAEAEAALAQAGYQREVQVDTSLCGSVVDGKVVEQGRVCSQSPAAGARSSPRVPIYIRLQTENPWHGQLGGGRSWFLMPDLTGIPLEKATAKIKALGFTTKDVKLSYIDDGSCAPNQVCRTYPERLTRTDTTSDKVFYVGRANELPGQAEPKPVPTTADAKPKPDVKPAKPPVKPSLGDAF